MLYRTGQRSFEHLVVAFESIYVDLVRQHKFSHQIQYLRRHLRLKMTNSQGWTFEIIDYFRIVRAKPLDVERSAFPTVGNHSLHSIAVFGNDIEKRPTTIAVGCCAVGFK